MLRGSFESLTRVEAGKVRMEVIDHSACCEKVTAN